MENEFKYIIICDTKTGKIEKLNNKENIDVIHIPKPTSIYEFNKIKKNM